ncbi:MAG: hypothetical protein O6850_02210 [Acidobacteria bacterium]|nr:hypothetical protein [Acidobacteriota bacterium]
MLPLKVSIEENLSGERTDPNSNPKETLEEALKRCQGKFRKRHNTVSCLFTLTYKNNGVYFPGEIFS